MSSIRGSSDESRKLIGERLRSERERLALSQVAAAKALDVSREAIRKYEAGENVPGGEALAYALEIGMDVRYVLTGLREGVTDGPAGTYAATPVVIDPLCEKLSGLSERQRQALLDFLIAFANV
jgi:transcriptional regulator with XRE-family HTH domain